MRKKIWGVAIIVAMAIATSWNFNQSQCNVNVNNLVSANIEALAAGEGPGPGSKRCYVTITEASSDDFVAIQVRDCWTCNTVWAISSADRALC